MTALTPVSCPKCLNSDPGQIKVWAEEVPRRVATDPRAARRVGWECLRCGHRWEDE